MMERAVAIEEKQEPGMVVIVQVSLIAIVQRRTDLVVDRLKLVQIRVDGLDSDIQRAFYNRGWKSIHGLKH